MKARHIVMMVVAAMAVAWSEGLCCFGFNVGKHRRQRVPACGFKGQDKSDSWHEGRRRPIFGAIRQQGQSLYYVACGRIKARNSVNNQNV